METTQEIESEVIIPRIESKKDFVEKLEEYNKGRSIRYDELKVECPELSQWLLDICHENPDDYFLIFKDKNRIKVAFYSFEYEYRISTVIPHNDKYNGYLGCIANRRKYRAGEHWLRGRDLPDGEYAKETWDSIVRAIVINEMQKLDCWDRFNNVGN